MKSALFLPMAFYVFFLAAVAVRMFFARVSAVRSGQVKTKYYRAQVGETPPEYLNVIGRHYDNQFQVPILYLVTCLCHMLVGKADELTLVLAWLFVGSRLAHSWIMLGRNNVLYRAGMFAVGWLLIVLMWIQLTYFVLAQAS